MEKLIQLHDVKTTTYLHNGFLVDVVETPDSIEVWIGHPDYGAKDMAFGLSPEILRSEGLDLQTVILNNLPEYEEFFEQTHFD